jgi:hypothetical protein
MQTQRESKIRKASANQSERESFRSIFLKGVPARRLPENPDLFVVANG